MRERLEKKKTHYKVSGGPIIETLHWKTFFSSTSPAEKPSTGFLHRSEKNPTKLAKPRNEIKSIETKIRSKTKTLEQEREKKRNL